MIKPQLIDDQEDLAPGPFDQRDQEGDKAFARDAALGDCKTPFAPRRRFVPQKNSAPGLLFQRTLFFRLARANHVLIVVR